MKLRIIKFIIFLFCVTFYAVSCDMSEPETDVPQQEITPAPYGYFHLGDEKIPVVSFVTASEWQYVLKISPLEDILTATTYAAVGVRSEFLGQEIDVETKFHNDDYIFVYEDPTRYYAPFRKLQSGTIFIDELKSGEVSVKVDVILYDGTHFKYENSSLITQS